MRCTLRRYFSIQSLKWPNNAHIQFTIETKFTTDKWTGKHASATLDSASLWIHLSLRKREMSSRKKYGDQSTVISRTATELLSVQLRNICHFLASLATCYRTLSQIISGSGPLSDSSSDVAMATDLGQNLRKNESGKWKGRFSPSTNTQISFVIFRVTRPKFTIFKNCSWIIYAGSVCI